MTRKQKRSPAPFDLLVSRLKAQLRHTCVNSLRQQSTEKAGNPITIQGAHVGVTEGVDDRPGKTWCGMQRHITTWAMSPSLCYLQHVRAFTLELFHRGFFFWNGMAVLGWPCVCSSQCVCVWCFLVSFLFLSSPDRRCPFWSVGLGNGDMTDDR